MFGFHTWSHLFIYFFEGILRRHIFKVKESIQIANISFPFVLREIFFSPPRTRKSKARYSSLSPGILTEMVCCRHCWNRLVIAPSLIIPKKAKLWQASNLAVLLQWDHFVFGNQKLKLHLIYIRNDSEQSNSRSYSLSSPGHRKAKALTCGDNITGKCFQIPLPSRWLLWIGEFSCFFHDDE